MEMDLFSPGFVSALLAIIAIDLVLAGDNAIVIALVARRLPAHLQRVTIIAGTVGAVAVRVVMTLLIVWLLNIPWLQLAGGLLLVWIAWKLLAPDQEDQHASVANAGQTTLAGAIRTIVVADAVMGLDNVLGVAGAAHGSFALVVIGLLISVPIMIFGSTLILKWVERYPVIIYGGAAVLAWTAAKMITSEPMLADFFARHTLFMYGLYVAIIGGVVASGMMRSRRARMLQEEDHEMLPASAAMAAMPEGVSVSADAPAAGIGGAAPVSAPAIVPSHFAASPASLEEENDMLRILVPVDGSGASLDAVRNVIKQAKRGRESMFIVLLNVQPRLNRHTARFLPKSTREGWRRERAESAMQQARQLLHDAGLSWDAAMATGDPGEAIAECARERGMHKIVMGTGKKSLIVRLFEDSVTNRVIELSPVPVEVVAREEGSLLERYGIPAGVGAGLALLLLAEE